MKWVHKKRSSWNATVKEIILYFYVTFPTKKGVNQVNIADKLIFHHMNIPFEVNKMPFKGLLQWIRLESKLEQCVCLLHYVSPQQTRYLHGGAKCCCS